MSNRVLEIIFRLKDEVTKNFSSMAKKFISDSRRMASQINDISRASLMLGAAITGPMALAFHGAARYSRAVSDELEKVKTVTAAFQLSVATAMIPTVQMLTSALGRPYQAWNGLGPVVQTNIVQIDLWVGIALTLLGLWGKLVAAFYRARAAIVAIALALTPLQIGIIAVVAVLGVMIAFWDKIKVVAIPVLNAIEIGIKMVQLGVNKMFGGLVDGLITAAVHLSGFMKVLARVPGAQQEAFLAASDALDKFSGSLRADSIEQHKMVAQIEGEMVKLLEAGSGGLAGNVDGFVEEIRKKFGDLIKWLSGPDSFDFKGMKSQLDEAAKQVKTMHDVFIDTSTQAAHAMARTMGDFFFNPFSEQVKSAREMFSDFGRSIVRILADVAAKWIITMTLGSMFPGTFNLLGLKFHSGGTVPKAHDGAFVNASPSREFPIMVRGGETIRTEAQEASVQRRMKGQNITIQPVVVIQAWDVQDIYRNRNAITGIVGDAIVRNASLRDIMRRYS